ncbi:LexA family protein [Paenibacillus thermotolerans]|uniref:LexA family protein n=1 Tax=Paenibacillus thermotolerans TaxID=3027807 RepID=UPI002367CDEE|nr:MULTISPECIES: MarR family transcriptional regulator [unclassified Paenibacillus]
MSKRDEILAFLSQYNNEKGFSPTVREIGSAVGLKSVSTVQGHLEKLEKQGLIRRIPSSARAIQVISEHKQINEVKVLKHNKGVPSVIQWEGRRYIFDPKG